MINLKRGDKIHISDTPLSPTGMGEVIAICRVSITVKFDTGSIGLYTRERNIPSLYPL